MNERVLRPFGRSCFLLFVLPLFVLSLVGASSARAQTIPSDAKATCTVTAAQFAGWFQSGSVAVNGVVKPANSVTFSNPAANCPFYQWSKQMFLWLTSPAPVSYGGGGGRIMDSPSFYDVSPPNLTTGNRTFIPHEQGVLRNLSLRAAQVGPSGLPVIVDTTGRVFEVAKPAPNEKPLVRSLSGRLVPLASISRSVDEKLVLQDETGKAITAAKAPAPVAHLQISKPVTLRKFILPGGIVFIDPSGNIIDAEQGQADDGVLLAQNGSLVYYVTMVNDVYAYFTTMVAHQTTKTKQFPTTQATLNPVVSFASAHGKTFPDPDALAIEVKSSWVEAAGLPNIGSYITMQAIIPTYNTSNPLKWTLTGQKTTTLALVGMHVVGSANGHPEMIWSTFEHFGNSPNATYQYINTSGQLKTVTQSTAGSWLFSKSNSSGPFNKMHADYFNAPDIEGHTPTPPPTVPQLHITPSDTLRTMAWGSSFNAAPSPLVPSAAAANTELISIHNSISSKLPAADIRSNYFMLGATWTIGGVGSTTSFGSPGNTGGNEVGTSQLNNTTMETYQQSPTTNFNANGGNCLLCHRTNTTSVSHDFPALQPLF
jgi:hypothetical protein